MPASSAGEESETARESEAEYEETDSVIEPQSSPRPVGIALALREKRMVDQLAGDVKGLRAEMVRMREEIAGLHERFGEGDQLSSTAVSTVFDVA